MLNLRFRTRLALVMFLTMACTTAALMVTYVRHDRQVKAYTTVLTSDLLQIVNVAQQHIPQNSDRKQALEFYSKALKDAGLSSITVALPSGEVVASSNPAQVGKKIPLKKRQPPSKENPIQISAELQDVDIDPSVEQKTYTIEFPIVQGEKVLGYVQIKGEMDAVGELLRKKYVDTLVLILCTMLMGMFAVVYLAFRFTKPIDLLVVGAQQVAQGNLYVSLPQGGTDEIGRLSGTFNQMVERLRQSRELQERLNEAEKLTLLGRFSAVVAHEVRNSLNFINLSIDQIRAKHTDGDARGRGELQRNLKNIKEEIGRLNHLVNDFLSVGRQMPPALRRATCAPLWKSAVSLAEKQGRRQNIKISVELPAELPVLPTGRGANQNVLPQYPDQRHPGHAARGRGAYHHGDMWTAAAAPGVCNCDSRTTVPAFPRKTARKSLRRSTPPRPPALAWDWPSPRKLWRTTADASLQLTAPAPVPWW